MEQSSSPNGESAPSVIRALPRYPRPDGKRPLFPAIFSRPVRADRAQQRRRTERELHAELASCRGRRQYDGAPRSSRCRHHSKIRRPALVFRLNLQWYNHVLPPGTTHFDAP